MNIRESSKLVIKVKTNDLKMLMKYIEREEPEVVTISEGEMFAIKFEFNDKEDRVCQVILYQESMGTHPDLVKKMKLETRIKK